MFLVFRDIENDIHLIESDKIVSIGKETENSWLVNLGGCYYIPTNKSKYEI